jgi:hypothetical protein
LFSSITLSFLLRQLQGHFDEVNSYIILGADFVYEIACNAYKWWIKLFSDMFVPEISRPTDEATGRVLNLEYNNTKRKGIIHQVQYLPPRIVFRASDELKVSEAEVDSGTS